ncbi:MAG: hypothetical protein ACQESD_06640 [Thermoplasmatota archaeon]
MNEKIKGDLFEKTFDYLEKKSGKMGLEKLSFDRENYPVVKWFPFSEYCRLLKEMYEEVMEKDPSQFYRMGYGMIKDDVRWKTVFQGKNPSEIFSTVKRQKEQYVVGDIKSERMGDKHIKVTMEINAEDELCARLWAESYHGRIQAVLDFTGSDGKIEKTLEFDKDRKACIYDIKWE